MEKISVIIPSYNHAEYIESCLDSVYFQDYPHLEIIVIDDNSDDNSVDVISKWLRSLEAEEVSFVSRYDNGNGVLKRTIHKRYNRSDRLIHFEVNTHNYGSTKTYNIGFSKASGRYCTFISSDDMMHPQFVSTLARPLNENIADFVYSDMFIIDDKYRILREFNLPDYSFEKSFCDWYLCGVAKLYRRSLHLIHGYYDDTSMADDHECYLRFAMNGVRFLHIPKTLYSVRSHHSRQVGLHSEKRFSALLEESKALTLKARSWHDGER